MRRAPARTAAFAAGVSKKLLKGDQVYTGDEFERCRSDAGTRPRHLEQ